MLCNQNQLAREIRWFSRMDIVVDGITATVHDRNQFITVSLLRYGLCADLLPGQDWDTCVYRRCLHNVKYVDIKLYAKDYKTLKEFYLSTISQPSGLTWHEFKRRVSTSIHYKWILTMLERLYSSPASLIQWLAFDERLQTDTNEDISSEIDDYISFEEGLRQYTYEQDILSELNGIIRHWFRRWEPSLEVPEGTFGPGATAELGRVSQLSKMENFSSDPSVKSLFVQMYYRHSEEFVPDDAPNIEASYQNRIIFVPKNALKHRIISAEPTWLTWYQQILKNSMYKYIEESHEMYTWFSNQERSRVLAVRGSVDGSYATIDFSSASDSITCTLVDSVFQNTYLHDLLLSTRSTSGVLPDGRVCTLEKFAPMGSATCFAVMDTIFLSICELSVRKVKGSRSSADDYTVYGDDVIIKSEYVPTFLDLCERLHLYINTSKSFTNDTGHHYRESCGVEALDGVDITPLRYSRFQEPIVSKAPISQSWWVQTIDLINRMQIHRFPGMRSVCTQLIKLSCDTGNDKDRRRLSSTIWKSLHRVDEFDFLRGDHGVYAVVVPDGTATNYHCKIRYNPDLQRAECRVIVPVVEEYQYYQSSYAYELWFLKSYNREHLVGLRNYDPIGSNPLLRGCAGTLNSPYKWRFKWVRLT